MNKKPGIGWYWFLVLSILVLSIFLRFYKLGTVPHGMTWDEAAIGYNGFAIFNTRRDEWLQRLPVSFQSFGDYKAPLAIYLNGIFTYLFGLNLFAVRLPFAIFSIIGIFGMILLVEEVFKDNRYSRFYALFAGLLMSTSPWHLHYSRAGFESGMALTFLIWGLLFLIKLSKNNFKNIWQSLVVVLSFVAAIYTYHSSKVMVPLLLISFFVLFFKSIVKNFKSLIFPGVIFVGLLFPFIKDSLFGEGLTRAGVTIFSSDITTLEKFVYILKSYGAHLSANFLIFGETTTLRHGSGFLGVLSITTFILAIFGLISFLVKSSSSLVKNAASFAIKATTKKSLNKDKYVFLGLIIIGLLPAAISLEVPHSYRSILALPGFILMAIYGVDWLIIKIRESKINKKVLGSHGETNIVLKSVIGSFLLFHIFLTVAFLNHYFTVFAKESADSFQDGYLEAFEIAQKYEKGLDDYPEVDKILFTSDYGQPYIYALFSRKTNPIWYRGGSLIKYEFTDKIDVGDLQRNNTLIVASATDELPIEKIKQIIFGSDGKVRFQIFLTESKQ